MNPRTSLYFSVGACVLAAFVLCSMGVLLYRQHQSLNPSLTIVQPIQAAPPQPHAEYTRTTSTGGVTTSEGALTGPSMRIDGDKVEADKLHLEAPALTLFDIGSVTGGALTGSFKASVSGTLWIRIIFALLALAAFALAYLNFRKNPLDWHFYGSLALGGVLCVVVAANPELLYIGLFGVAIAAALNFLPSITASRTIEASKNYEDFIASAPDIKARWTSFRESMTSADKSVIDNVIKKNNV